MSGARIICRVLFPKSILTKWLGGVSGVRPHPNFQGFLLRHIRYVGEIVLNISNTLFFWVMTKYCRLFDFYNFEGSKQLDNNAEYVLELMSYLY